MSHSRSHHGGLWARADSEVAGSTTSSGAWLRSASLSGIIKIHSRPDSESGSHRVTAAAARGPGPGPGHPDEAS